MKKEILAVVHARGGSKRIPLKNLAVLGGKPLVAYPVLLAKSSTLVTRVILSTDHDKIMEEGKRFGAEVPFRRPADISEDVPSELVTLHAVEFLKEKENYSPDIVITLTPATPLTTVSDLNQGIELLMKHDDWDSVITVRKASEHPEWLLWRDEKTGLYQTILGNSLDGEYNVSQNLRPAFYPSGAFYINRTSSLLNQRSLYGKKYGAVMLSSAKIDIDTPADLAVAQAAVGDARAAAEKI